MMQNFFNISTNTNTSLRTSESTCLYKSTSRCSSTVQASRKSTLNCTSAASFESVESYSIMCLVKGRGKAMCETGIASIDLRRNVICVSQFCDDQLDTQFLTKTYLIDPVEIVVAHTLKESSNLQELFQKLSTTFPNCELKGVPRRFMSESKGKDYVHRLCSGDSVNIDVALQSKVYALLAVSGLISYVEESLGMYFAPHTITMVFQSGENAMLLDYGTALNLELLRSTASGNQLSPSLYTVLNHTQTLTGALALRSNLLEPPTDVELIKLRYEAVEELVSNVELFTSLQSALSKFPDIEKAITLCIQIPRMESRASSESKLRNLLCLKTALDLVPCIAETLRSATSGLLKTIQSKLLQNGLERILQLIISKLNSKAMVISGLLSMRGQLVFAVKQGLDGKLDAMRNVYNSLVDETEAIVRHLCEAYQLAFKLNFSTQRGFHVTLKTPVDTVIQNLPEEFIKVTKGRGVYNMTTDKLIILNARITECLNCIYDLSNRIVTQLLSEIHKEIHCLNGLVNAIGTLDMIVSFAHTSRISDYICPQIGDVLALKSARHPVAMIKNANSVVPNDLYLAKETNFIVITGANNSGKSFYMRTIGIIQIMAQIGCFVPAEFAMIRVCDQLFSRIGSDSSTYNLESSFTVEMKEIGYLLKQCTQNSLVLLDELCRGTNAAEGTDICFAVCQKLLKQPAFTLFATHFKQLCQLETMFKNCANYCMVTKYEGGLDSEFPTIINDYKLRKGIAKEFRYGLKLAASMKFPKRIIEDSYEIADQIEGLTQKRTKIGAADDDYDSVDVNNNRTELQIFSEISLIQRFDAPLEEKIEALKNVQQKYKNQLAQLKESYSLATTATTSNSNDRGQKRKILSNARFSGSKIALNKTKCEHDSSLQEQSTSDCETSVQLSSSSKEYIAQSKTHSIKLVDYPLSPISIAGSSLQNAPHSFMSSPRKIYKASTNKTNNSSSNSQTLHHSQPAAVLNSTAINTKINKATKHIYCAVPPTSEYRRFSDSESAEYKPMTKNTSRKVSFFESNDASDDDFSNSYEQMSPPFIKSQIYQCPESQGLSKNTEAQLTAPAISPITVAGSSLHRAPHSVLSLPYKIFKASTNKVDSGSLSSLTVNSSESNVHLEMSMTKQIERIKFNQRDSVLKNLSTSSTHFGSHKHKRRHSFRKVSFSDKGLQNPTTNARQLTLHNFLKSSALEVSNGSIKKGFFDSDESEKPSYKFSTSTTNNLFTPSLLNIAGSSSGQVCKDPSTSSTMAMDVSESEAHLDLSDFNNKNGLLKEFSTKRDLSKCKQMAIHPNFSSEFHEHFCTDSSNVSRNGSPENYDLNLKQRQEDPRLVQTSQYPIKRYYDRPGTDNMEKNSLAINRLNAQHTAKATADELSHSIAAHSIQSSSQKQQQISINQSIETSDNPTSTTASHSTVPKNVTDQKNVYCFMESYYNKLIKPGQESFNTASVTPEQVLSQHIASVNNELCASALKSQVDARSMLCLTTPSNDLPNLPRKEQVNKSTPYEAFPKCKPIPANSNPNYKIHVNSGYNMQNPLEGSNNLDHLTPNVSKATDSAGLPQQSDETATPAPKTHTDLLVSTQNSSNILMTPVNAIGRNNLMTIKGSSGILVTGSSQQTSKRVPSATMFHTNSFTSQGLALCQTNCDSTIGTSGKENKLPMFDELLTVTIPHAKNSETDIRPTTLCYSSIKIEKTDFSS